MAPRGGAAGVEPHDAGPSRRPFARLSVLRVETGLQKNFWSRCRVGGHKGVRARKARKTRASPDYSLARTARGNRASLFAKGTVYCTGRPYVTDHGIAGMARKKVQKRT